MRNSINQIKKEYAEISAELNSPEIFGDSRKMAELGKKQAEMSEIVRKIEDL
jgi:protein subunit release factor A